VRKRYKRSNADNPALHWQFQFSRYVSKTKLVKLLMHNRGNNIISDFNGPTKSKAQARN